MILLVVLIIVLSIYYTFMYRRYNRHLNKVAGPSNIPFLGCSMIFCSTNEILPKFYEYYKKYGSVFKVRIGPIKHYVVFADAKSAECILNSSKYIDKSDDYELFHPWLSTGLLTSTGEKWRKRRKLLTPTFHFSILERFVDVFDKAGDKLVEKLKSTTGQAFDISPYVSLCSLDIVCESAMGVTISAQEQPDVLYVKSVKRMSQIILERIIEPFKRWELTYKFTKTSADEKECLKVLHGFTKQVIKKRKQELLSKASEKSIQHKKQAFLDLLLQMTEDNGSNVFTEDEIQEEVDTFMFEGHDTTTSAISFAIHCLASHKDIQNKLRKELFEVLQTKCKNITYQELQRLPYLELVIKETLRLYPSVPFFSRSLSEDAELGGVKIPKHCSVTVIPYIIHRDPAVYPEPTTFDPERFRNINNRLPYAYIPFSAGPRNCIGQKFAMLVMKTVLAKVIMAYEINPTVPAHVPVIAAEAVLKPANGIKIILANL